MRPRRITARGRRAFAVALAAGLVGATLLLGVARPAAADVVDPKPYDQLLGAHVKAGQVDYAGLKAQSDALDAYLAALAKPELSTALVKASRAEKLAFWMNAYNAATLQLIVKHHGDIASIRDIDEPWKKPKWTVAGQSLSLDEMEHRRIRAEIGDPRIHFALVCAAKSCPDLRSEAYTAARVDAQLDDATRGFLAAKKGAQVELRDGKPVLKLSKIFEWYGGDFGDTPAAVAGFVARHAPPAVAAFIREHQSGLAIEYLPYDWSLNKK